MPGSTKSEKTRPTGTLSANDSISVPEKRDMHSMATLHNQRVYCSMLDGKAIIGLLKGYGRYMLEVERGNETLYLYKHAVRYLRLARTEEV